MLSNKAAQSIWERLPKPTRKTYNYALECALLGISALVLIQTQRGALRFGDGAALGRTRGVTFPRRNPAEHPFSRIFVRILCSCLRLLYS